ncbi:hypothetical protein CBL_20721 [Carabus blaptoides fortunei]
MFSERTEGERGFPAFMINQLVAHSLSLFCEEIISSYIVAMPTDYLKEVLRIAPSTWTGTTYTSTNYATVQLEEDSDEYTDLVQTLREESEDYEDGISRIERVQHPFAYGRFVLRREQLKKRYGTCEEPNRYCMQINKTDVKSALEYNMDQRRTPWINRDFPELRDKAGAAVVRVKFQGSVVEYLLTSAVSICPLSCSDHRILIMSSDYLAEVLQFTPSTWTHTSYTSTNYVTVPLTEYSSEYEGIVSALRATHTSLAEQISKIERVQHPFAYGRFVLRQEQLEKRTRTKRTPTRYFLQVKESQLREALEYNMDARRTPLDNSNRRTTAGKCVVLVQSLGAPSTWQRDCECYPEYVVYYTGTLPARTTPSLSQYRNAHSEYLYDAYYDEISARDCYGYSDCDSD